MALIHAFLVVTLRANQIVSGLALTIFAGAAGLSSYLGNDLDLARRAGASTRSRRSCRTGCADAPRRRPDPVRPDRRSSTRRGCASLLVALYLARTRPGLNVRAVGESPAAADAMGINVAGYRYAHTIAGGAFAGVGGASFSLAITPQWVDGLTAGAGWIAIALVIFAFWRPALCLVGAYLFGAFSGAPVHVPGAGRPRRHPARALPGAAVRDDDRRAGAGLDAPARAVGWARRAALGMPYVREER